MKNTKLAISVLSIALMLTVAFATAAPVHASVVAVNCNANAAALTTVITSGTLNPGDVLQISGECDGTVDLDATATIPPPPDLTIQEAPGAIPIAAGPCAGFGSCIYAAGAVAFDIFGYSGLTLGGQGTLVKNSGAFDLVTMAGASNIKLLDNSFAKGTSTAGECLDVSETQGLVVSGNSFGSSTSVKCGTTFAQLYFEYSGVTFTGNTVKNAGAECYEANCVVDSNHFAGSAGNAASTGFECDEGRCAVTNNVFDDPYDAVPGTGDSFTGDCVEAYDGSVAITGNTMAFCGSDGFEAYSLGNSKVNHNTITQVGSDGIDLGDSGKVGIRFNTITKPSSNGFYFYDSARFFVTDNTVTKAGSDAMYMYDVTGFDVERNTLSVFSTATGNGIWADSYTSGSTFSENHIISTGLAGGCTTTTCAGIYFDEAFGNTVSSNTIDVSAYSSIALDDSGYNTVTGNTIGDAGDDGIVVGTGASYSAFNKITSNTITTDPTGVNGIGVSDESTFNSITGNTITGWGATGVALADEGAPGANTYAGNSQPTTYNLAAYE